MVAVHILFIKTGCNYSSLDVLPRFSSGRVWKWHLGTWKEISVLLMY